MAISPGPVKNSSTLVLRRTRSNSHPVVCWDMKPVLHCVTFSTMAPIMMMANARATSCVNRPRMRSAPPAASTTPWIVKIPTMTGLASPPPNAAAMPRPPVIFGQPWTMNTTPHGDPQGQKTPFRLVRQLEDHALLLARRAPNASSIEVAIESRYRESEGGSM